MKNVPFFKVGVWSGRAGLSTSIKSSERVALALLFTAIGSLIYIVFSPLRPLFDPVTDYLGRLGLIAILLAAVLWTRKIQRLEKVGQVLLGLLIMAIAVSLDRILGIYLIVYLKISDTAAAGWAVQKLNECFVVVCAVVALTRMTGGSLGSIYIQKGHLKQGLSIGLVAFFLAAAGSVPMASLFKAQNLTLEKIMGWLPWLLIFALANATQEELLFRGLFLRKLEPFFGKFISNALIVLIFTLLHRGVDYTASEALFLVVLVPLALAWGAIMQKTDSIWGSILFHAGMDIPVMLGIFSNL